MGIKNLNEYFLKHCSKKSIKHVHLRQFWGKTIAIDTSIFIYRFLGNGTLMKEMNQMLETLQRYKIRPIFVFDGKSPIEKAELLQERRLKKREANEQIKDIEENQTAISKQEFDLLKKKAVRISYADLDNTRDLLDAYGISHCRAMGEADKLCAQLVKKNIAWAAMSDDMDLFLYDCPRVIRCVSIKRAQCSLYDTTQIFRDLSIKHEQFLKLMIITGTDYNKGTCSIEEVFERYRQDPQGDIYNGLTDDIEHMNRVWQLFQHEDQIEYRSNLILYDNPPAKNVERIKQLIVL